MKFIAFMFSLFSLAIFIGLTCEIVNAVCNKLGKRHRGEG
jgi:hypothetical protein